MKIRTASARIDGNSTTQTIDSKGLEIIADDNSTLFRLKLVNGELQIRTGGYCVHEGKECDDKLLIEPCSNGINVSRKAYPEEF